MNNVPVSDLLLQDLEKRVADIEEWIDALAYEKRVSARDIPMPFTRRIHERVEARAIVQDLRDDVSREIANEQQ
jgi:hypothetical protein